MCKIDVILPIYNHADLVPAAIDSILSQTLADFKLIIVNDGSTDNIEQVLQAFTDPRISIIVHNENRGLPTALNTGHASGKSPFCTWVSSDNVSHREHLQALYDKITEGYDFVQGLYKVIHGNKTCTINNAQKCADNWGYGNLGATFLYARMVWDIYHYNESLHGAEDLEFFLKAWLHPFKFGFVDQILVDYYQHPRSMSNSGLNFDNLHNKVHQSVFGPKPEPKPEPNKTKIIGHK